MISSASSEFCLPVKTVLAQILAGEFKGGVVENLGLVSENPEENYVQLPSSTQWSDGFTEEDYKALVAAIFNGEIVVSNNIDITPAENVTVISVNDLGNIK